MSVKTADRLAETRRRSGGFALLMVLMLIATASVVGISYIYGSQVKTASTNNLILASEARYLAESGLQHGLYGLQRDVLPFGSAVAPNGPYHAVAGDGGYVFYIRTTSIPNDYQIVSKGTAGGISQTVAMTVRLTSEYATKMLALGGDLKNWWRLGDSGLTAVDSKGGKDGTYINNVTRGVRGAIIGDLDTCADFDGSNDYVELLDVDKLDDNKITIGCWAKSDGWATAYPRLIARSTGTGASDQFFMLGTESGKRLRVVLNVNNSPVDLRSVGNAVQIGEWFFAVATFNKDTRLLKLYKNGELIASTVTALGGQVKDDNNFDVRIGDTPMGDSRRWRGPIDEVFIMKNALTAEQIKELYDARIPNVEVISWDD